MRARVLTTTGSPAKRETRSLPFTSRRGYATKGIAQSCAGKDRGKIRSLARTIRADPRRKFRAENACGRLRKGIAHLLIGTQSTLVTRIAAKDDRWSRSTGGESSPYLFLHARGIDRDILTYRWRFSRACTRKRCAFIGRAARSAHGTMLVSGFYELLKWTGLQVRQSATGRPTRDSVSSKDSRRCTRNT